MAIEGTNQGPPTAEFESKSVTRVVIFDKLYALMSESWVAGISELARTRLRPAALAW